MIAAALYKEHFDVFETKMLQWIDFLRSQSTKDELANNTVKPLYFDALPFNIIVDTSGQLNLFDLEWEPDESFSLEFLIVRYLVMYKKKRGLYRGYSKSYLGFVNRVLRACKLKEINKSTLRKYELKDEAIRNTINRVGGLTPIATEKVIGISSFT